MAGENEDFGINDPNILALLSGVNSPQAMAALLSSADNSGAMFLPGIKRRQQETTRSVLEMMGENNIARALLHNKKMDIGRLKDQETYVGNMMNHAPNLAKEGILSSASPYDVFFRRPGAERSDQLNLEGKEAYNQNQRAEAFNRHAQTGQVVDEGQNIDPNVSRMPLLKKNSSRIPSVLAALARANANDGKRVDQYGANDEFLGSTVTRSGAGTPSHMSQPGDQRLIAPAPAAEQAIRAKISSINPKLAKVPIGYDPTTKSYVAKYQSVDGEKTIRTPADPSRRPIVDKLTIE